MSNSPRKSLAHALKNKHHVILADYDELVIHQVGTCAICGDVRPLVVDHSHRDGGIRGLLCRMCNRMLGWFEEHQLEIERVTSTRWVFVDVLSDRDVSVAFARGFGLEVTGSSKRRPEDSNDREVGKALATARAFQALGKKLERAAHGHVKHKDDMKAKREERKITRFNQEVEFSGI